MLRCVREGPVVARQHEKEAQSPHAVLAEAPAHHGYYCLVFTTLAGVVISLYYYFGVIRAIYWSRDAADLSPIPTSKSIRVSLYACLLGMFLLGVYPGPVLDLASEAARALKF